jgi:hypothetical protein
MSDLLFLVPLLVGLGIMALGFKFQVPRGTEMNRPAFGITLVTGSLFWWLSSAILLVYEGQFYFILNIITVVAFFSGLAFFFPLPDGATRLNEHGLPGNILIWTGLILGLAHSLALMFTAAWPARLLEWYASLGLHAPPPSPI